MAIQRLTAAYRSRSRPSSTPGAKASTMCPSYLDGDQALLGPEGSSRAPGDTRWLAADRRDQLPVGMVVQFSRSAGGASPGLGDRSLKTQQHAPTGTDS